MKRFLITWFVLLFGLASTTTAQEVKQEIKLTINAPDEPVVTITRSGEISTP